MQDGLKAGIDHGKAGRDLSVIEAYDPSAEAKYVDAVNALRTVDFSLLSVLKSKKDACMADLMDSLRLEGPLAEIPRAKELQPSLEQLMLPIHRAEDDVVLGETSLSFSLQVSLIGEASTSAFPATAEPVTTLSTTFASSCVVPPLFVSDYQVSDAEPHDEDPPVITFEEEELDMTLKSTMTFHARDRLFSLRSLSLYAPLPNAYVTSYGPSHLGPSFPPSSAWLASLLRSKLISKASSFFIISISAVLKVGMPISTRITASVPYVSENGVSPLLYLIIVRCAHKTCDISSNQFLLLLSNHALIPSPKLLFSLSTKSLAYGCLTKAKH
ncbi:hypothetical protein Tco_1068633 [Tanacetum coccineum]|uniref:Uncharacterized protein n=1 Tax=Tanacetum coccineum TaxID=301880 RepID=A0ABQ5HGG0_9ASTR